MTTIVHPAPGGARSKLAASVHADVPTTPSPVSVDLDAQQQLNQEIEQAVTDQQNAWSTAQAAVQELLTKNQALADLVGQQAANQAKVVSDTQTLLAQIQANARSLADSLNGIVAPTP